MSLTIRQYALLFALVTIGMIVMFAFQSWSEFTSTRENISRSQEQAASRELNQKVSQVNSEIADKTREFSQWEEVHQQLSDSKFFSYWYNVRLKQTSHKLQRIVTDLMLYDSSGKALAELSENTLPVQLERLPEQGLYYFESTDHQIYSLPIHSSVNQQVSGYLAMRIDLTRLLIQNSNFYYLQPEQLAVSDKKTGTYSDSLPQDFFLFETVPTPEIQHLEKQLYASIQKLILLVIIPMMVLYAMLVYIVSVPINGITQFISRLRNSSDIDNSSEFKGFFQVRELTEVYNSLIHYHSDLYDTHAVLDQKNKALWEQAHHDALTGVFNRRAFDDQWQNLNDLLSEQRVHVSFLLFDINLFKTINDTHGHQIGDEVIKAIAKCISYALRKGEHVFRLGGDEFAIFLIDTTTPAAVEIAQRCLDEIAAFNFADVGMPEPVRVSIGISQAQGGEKNAFEDLHWQADAAMYAAKRPGASDIVIYSDEITQGSKGLLSSWLSNTVYQAIDKGTGLQLFYQPIVDFRDDRVSYYEALVRIIVNGEMISPGSIFNVVEARHFEIELDRAVIRQLEIDLDAGKIPESTGVSLNLSGQTVTRAEILEWLQPLQRFTGKYKIVLEVTETALITELGKVSGHLKKLGEMQFVIALDDFGSGYSSVKYLASMPVDIVKFDITIVQSLMDESQRVMISRLAQMIDEVGHVLVAEGIEDSELLEIVLQTGFHFGQGFLFGRAEAEPAIIPSEKLLGYFPS
jgi:diguanylate cyclase (GGDEF)-like protein